MFDLFCTFPADLTVSTRSLLLRFTQTRQTVSQIVPSHPALAPLLLSPPRSLPPSPAIGFPLPSLLAVEPFHYTDRRKPQVDSKIEGEVKSSFYKAVAEAHEDSAASRARRNFVAENAVSAIRMKPPKEAAAVASIPAGFAKVPKYLRTIKQELDMERQHIEAAVARERERERGQQRRAQQKVRVMSEEERQQLLGNLKQKWETVNKAYQTTTHIVTLDSVSKLKRREECEQQLIALERSIEKLSKKVVYVYDDVSAE